MESSADKTAHLPEFDEPLLLGEEARVPGRWSRMLAYLAGCLILSGCLVAQLLYFYQDYFLRHALWRPVISDACELLTCQLSPEKNADALRSVFLTVDPHPDYQDMLLVQFKVRNTAFYPQALPSVELLFSNISNEPVAGRRFYPGHYLPVPVLAAGMIAPGAEVEGKIEISSPAGDAVNYTLEFVYAND